MTGHLQMKVVKNLLKSVCVWWLVQCTSGIPSIYKRVNGGYISQVRNIPSKSLPKTTRSAHQFQSLYRFNAQILGVPEVRSLRPMESHEWDVWISEIKKIVELRR